MITYMCIAYVKQHMYDVYVTCIVLVEISQTYT